MNLRSLLLCLCVGALPLALAAAEEHHHHHDGAVSLHLNQGQKWATDGPLRQGMDHIRTAMAAKLPAIHAKHLSPVGYERLAASLEAEVGGIVAACKLPEESDAMLHLVLADLGAGIEIMAGHTQGGEPRQGALRVLGALEEYGRYFDHPGWKTLAH